MVYQWRHGGRITGNVQAVGEELDDIRNSNGGLLQPKHIVGKAKKHGSVLHPYFEWDDSTAAQEHRLTQARTLLRSIVIVAEEHEEFEPVRAFVCIGESEDHPKAYIHVKDAMSNEDIKREVLKQAKDELASWRKRYADLKAFSELFEFIDSIV